MRMCCWGNTLGLLTLVVVLSWITAQRCLDTERVCHRPPYCTQGEVIAGPDCTTYYQCAFGKWQQLDCPAGSQFDTAQCACVLQGTADCPNRCPFQTQGHPKTNDTCVEVPEPCTEVGKRYASSGDCEWFWECQPDGSLVLRQCVSGMTSGCPAETGYSCAFDINIEDCAAPDSNFDCDTRCVVKKDLEYLPENESKIASDTEEVGRATCLGFDQVCDRPDYCTDNLDQIGDFTNCSLYYVCSNAGWDRNICPAGTEYDSVSCECRNIGSDITCATTAACPTVDPGRDCNGTEYGTCDGIFNGESCDAADQNLKVADQMCCEYYYQCFGGMWTRRVCNIIDCGGTACAFNIQLGDCATPDANFDCSYRCLTTVEPTTVEVTTQTTRDPNSTDPSTTTTTTTTVGQTPTTPESPGMEPWAVATAVLVVVGLPIIIIIVVMLVLKKNKVSHSKDDDSVSDSEDEDDV